jgi:hypothetical protein
VHDLAMQPCVILSRGCFLTSFANIIIQLLAINFQPQAVGNLLVSPAFFLLFNRRIKEIYINPQIYRLN